MAELGEISEKFESGDFYGAKIDMEAYVETNDDNEYAWTILGHIYEKLDQDSLASKSYKKALQLKPEMEEALTGMGIVSRKSGDFEKATSYYERAIEINPEYAQAYSSLVAIYLQSKEFNKAIEVGEKSYRLDKSDPVIAANLSVAYHFAGDTINREKYFDIARKMRYANMEALRELFDGELTLFD
ncbi:MAG: hypothetical protein Aureis2KO_20590 [Aureisphaera sp.]